MATKEGFAPNLAGREQPQSSADNGLWASDVIAELIRDLKIPFLAFNPGATFRGLHDSIVNHLGNEQPQLVLCLHEEHAVAIAHGWARVTETPMGVILHSNVGLMHGAMAIFNAWCDRAPVIVLGATGPVDADKRRPWIDWIHTATDQAALVRHYTKWDNQPASVPAAREALLRANMIAQTSPKGPVYVCLDAGLQETRADGRDLPPVSPDRYRPPASPEPATGSLRRVRELLGQSERPLILCGRGGRSPEKWSRRVELAERLNAAVLTDLKTAATFPNRHRFHAAAAGIYIDDRSADLIRRADVIVSLDWVDLGGVVKTAGLPPSAPNKIVHVSLDQLVHNGWSMDHQILPAVDEYVLADPDAFVERLLEASLPHRTGEPWFDATPAAPDPTRDTGEITVAEVAMALRRATSGQKVCLVRVASSWSGDFWPVEDPLDFLGYDGGGGLASGPGLLVGASLALRGDARMPVAVLGDGDFLMGNTALWTAAHYGLAGLIVVVNNRSYFNDEMHQERVAIERGRNTGNRWIGQRIADPLIDISGLARAQGCVGFGPVTSRERLHSVLAEAVTVVLEGKMVVVDVHVAGSTPPGTSRSQDRG